MTDQVGRSPAHLDRDFFKASIDRTERETGFFGRLIEKDYYCSLILAHLFERDGANAFVFKGGTALNKVHFGFYRLSEDLDFSIAIPLDATRGDRRKARAPFEERLAALPKTFPAFSFSKAWKGAM